MKIRKLYKKIENHQPEIMFGILSGCGLMFIVSALLIFAIMIVPALQSYITILYIILYLVILIPTSIYYTKGWFRIIYLASALILLLTYIYTKIFGVVS